MGAPKTYKDFDTDMEYEAYLMTLLVGGLLEMDDEQHSQVFDYLVDTLEMEGGFDADVVQEVVTQVKVILGDEEAVESDPNTTH